VDPHTVLICAQLCGCASVAARGYEVCRRRTGRGRRTFLPVRLRSEWLATPILGEPLLGGQKWN